MIAARISPRVVTLGMALQLALGTILTLLASFGWAAYSPWIDGAIKSSCAILAFAIAAALSVEVAAEYRHTFWLRAAWLALAASAGASILRYAVHSDLLNLVWENYKAGPLHGALHQITILAANSFLLLGVLAMWRAHQNAGLGFRIEGRDYVAMVGILALLFAILFKHEDLPAAQSPYFMIRHIEQISLVILSIVSAASLVLHRLAMQMGGGKLALALRWIMFYSLLRGLLVFLGMLPEFSRARTLGRFLVSTLWQMAPWLIALAVAYRAQVTVQAARELEQRRATNAVLTPVA